MPTLVILGAGRPYRGDSPSALVNVSPGMKVLDWTLNAFSCLSDVEIFVVSGYRFEELFQSYPQLRFCLNTEWASTGPAKSLSLVPHRRDEELYICYSDVVFRPALVEALAENPNPVCLAVDTAWRSRTASRTEYDLSIAEKVVLEDSLVRTTCQEDGPDSAEFIGVLRISKELSGQYHRLLEEGKSGDGLLDLVQALIDSGIQVGFENVEGDWAELNIPQDLGRFVLGGKSETLARLKPLVKRSLVGDQVTVTRKQWEQEGERFRTLEEIRQRFSGAKLAVRSSSRSEDGWEKSGAGAHLSLLGVSAETDEMARAIQEVFDSFESHPQDRTMVQEMVESIAHTGVVLTRTLTEGAPYYVFNSSPDSDGVTGGGSDQIQVSYVLRGSEPPEALSNLWAAVREVESLVAYDRLDLEYAQTENGDLHLLQVRPLVAGASSTAESDHEVLKAVRRSQELFRQLQQTSPWVLGDQACFGVMPDWNPAEIIGRRPRILASQLYRYLITDEVWAQQRAEYGYRDVRPCALMVSFAGQPFIDTRASINSFVPAVLHERLALKLVDHALERLRRSPEFHDKIEFEVIPTAFTFRTPTHLNENFSPDEQSLINSALKTITLKGLGRVQQDMRSLETLRARYETFRLAHNRGTVTARALLQDCRRFGTLAFAHLARGAFVATTLLRSLLDLDAIQPEELEQFLTGLSSVTADFELAGERVYAGEMSWEDFVLEYGHLRPGTYDVTSLRYDEDPEKFLRPAVRERSHTSEKSKLVFQRRDRIKACLDVLGLEWSQEKFFETLALAIRGRELSKFLFTRNLSLALKIFCDEGLRLGLSREEISHLPLCEALELGPGSSTETLRDLSRHHQKRHQLTARLEFPPLIFCEDDFERFTLSTVQPNFVTQKVATAPVCLDPDNQDPEGKIVVLERADPGYDWIFARNICGLVTQYGGTNSHMAIRSAELSIPAAIGVGRQLFESIARGRALRLDGRQRKLEVL